MSIFVNDTSELMALIVPIDVILAENAQNNSRTLTPCGSLPGLAYVCGELQIQKTPIFRIQFHETHTYIYGFCYAAPIGAFFCPEIRAFTGFWGETSSTVCEVLSDRKVLFKHKNGR